MLTGVDVSRWQDVIDWPAVAASGERFAIVRCLGSEGVEARAVDPTFLTNVNGAKSAGLLVGAYAFAWWRRSPEDWADSYADMLGQVELDLLPAVDVEAPHVHQLADRAWHDQLTPGERVEWVARAVDRLVERTGAPTVLLYTGVGYWRTMLDGDASFVDCPLWAARYSGVPGDLAPHGSAPWPRAAVHQWTSTGRVPGIAGNVDRNSVLGDVDQIMWRRSVQLPYVEARNWRRGPRRAAVRMQVIHETISPERAGGARAVAGYFASSSQAGSTHTVTDASETVQCVPWDSEAYGAAGGDANRSGEHHELVGPGNQQTAGSPGWQDDYSQRELRLAARVVAWRCQVRGLPIRWMSDDDIRGNGRGLCTHADITRAFGVAGGHVDPTGFPRDQFLGLVLEAAGESIGEDGEMSVEDRKVIGQWMQEVEARTAQRIRDSELRQNEAILKAVNAAVERIVAACRPAG